MLRGAPESPAYSRSIIPSQIERTTISDIAYSDFAGQGLFYIAQTDWSGGIKNEKKWRDDAQFYYSVNIDAYSKLGSFQLEKTLTSAYNFSEDVNRGVYGTVGGNNRYYLGTDDDAGGKPVVYESTAGTATWSNISNAQMTTNQNAITELKIFSDTLWVGSAGAGNTNVVLAYDGSAWTDHSAAIIAVLTASSIKSCRSIAQVGQDIYCGVADYLNDWCAIVKYNGSAWSKIAEWQDDNTIRGMINYNSNIYYLKNNELRKYDIANSTDITIHDFLGASIANNWKEGDYLHILNGKLVITVPWSNDQEEIWEYDGSTLSRVFQQKEEKAALALEKKADVYYGGILHLNKIYWHNLVYDGENFYNYIMDNNDASGRYWLPILSNGSSRLYGKNLLNETNIYYTSTSYKAGSDKNYIVFSEIEIITGIDKLFHALTIVFDKFDTGESIKIQYSIDNRENWTTIGTATVASEGTNTKRVFFIPGNVIFNKIWFKVFLNGDGTSTPKLNDLIMAYKPMPDYKNQWRLMLNFSDGVKLLNRQQEEYKGNELNAKLWNEKLTKQKVIFEDVDYIECDLVSAMTAAHTSALVDSAKRFPRQGRIRAVSGNVAEEMYYTSAQSNKILGITRGARGTKARAYSAAQQLDNGYYVYIEDIKTNINFTDERKTESIAQVLLIES